MVNGQIGLIGQAALRVVAPWLYVVATATVVTLRQGSVAGTV